MFEYVGRFERVMFEVDINCRHRVRQDHMIRPQDHLIPTTSSNDKHSIQVDARLIDIKKLPAWNEVRGSHFSTKLKSRTNPVCIGDFTAWIKRACFWKEIRWNRDANCTTKKFVYSISILKETEKRILCYHILFWTFYTYPSLSVPLSCWALYLPDHMLVLPSFHSTTSILSNRGEYSFILGYAIREKLIQSAAAHRGMENKFVS